MKLNKGLTAALAAGFLGTLWAAEPARVIFDTDMLTDFDDVGALACLHALADAGEAEILATVTCTRGNASVGAVQVINSYYGRGDLPVGCTKGIGIVGDHACKDGKKVDPNAPLVAPGQLKGDGGHYKYRKLLADYPGWYTYADSDQAPDANEVYRKALASAPDHSVTICTVGFLSNLRRLLETKGDAYSPLDGKALVAQKVKVWVAMACKYPRGKEYNSQWDAESSKIAMENWPTPVVFSDWEYGGDLFAGRAVAEMPGPRNPVKDVFAGNIPSREEVRQDPALWQRRCFGMGGRSAWDETAVLAAVRGLDTYFNVHRGRYRMIGDQGENEWVPCEDGPHVRITEKMKKDDVGRVIDELITRPPARSKTPPRTTPVFTQLKPGAVKPTGWLHEQLRLQAEGLTGHAEELYDDIGNSTWLTHQKGKNAQYDWERGPYYARGLLPLAWILGDEQLQAKAKRWVEALFSWQQENGDIGPRRENWWANMLALTIIRDWYLISGETRCLDYITKYAKFQLEALKASPLMRDFGDRKGAPPWASARGGDELEVLLDVYDVTKDAALLEAARLVASQTAPWTDYYYTGAPNKAYQQHIVNFNQGLKTPSQLWRLGMGDVRRLRGAYAAATGKDGWTQRVAGRPDGMQNGEEPLRDRETTGGTELCAQVERIVSCADQVAVFADARAADDLESIAYNCLPATLAPDCRGLRYYLALNQPKCTNEKTDYCNNGDKVNCLVPSPHAGFGCCRSNFHIGWPKFVQSMWMKVADGGYAAVAYGPCRLETPEVTIVETTDYPFRDRVVLEVVKGGGSFPLYVRVPSWAKVPDAGTFRRIARTWKLGEKVELCFASDPVVEKGWNRDAAVVRKGALLYSWPVPHTVKVTKDYGNGFATRELHHQSTFNVALDLRGANQPMVVDDGRPLAAQPFDVATAPVHLRVKGCRTDEADWGTFRHDARELMAEPPPSPISAPQGAEDLDLIPLGCTQTRITLFPWRR